MNYKIKKLLLLPMNLAFYVMPVFVTKTLFFLKNGYKLNLSEPVTFNEKIQWIKFYDKNSRMPFCSDKYEVRSYLKEIGCDEILIPLLWEGTSPEQIPYQELPEQFVIKVTHGSGFNIICSDKEHLNRTKVNKQLRKWLKERYLPCYGEWFYGVRKPRIIIEEYIGHNKKSPDDYKIYCFHGTPKLIQVHRDRFDNHRMKLFDVKWNEIGNVTMKYPCDTQTKLKKPEQLDTLLAYASKLSAPFLHARVDFYLVENKIYFGEITFTDGAGFDKIYPRSFDIELGNYLKLPLKRREATDD